MEKMKYPIIILLARDWNLFKDLESIDEDFHIAEGWISGFLISESDDTYIVAAEIFPEDITKNSQVRYTQAIPKETVLFKKLVYWYKDKKKTQKKPFDVDKIFRGKK